MSLYGSLGRFVGRLGRVTSGPTGRPSSRGRLPSDGRARLVRRAAVRCPHTGQPVTVDLLLGVTGSPEVALRCPAWGEQRPSCDEACCKLIEAVTGPALALLVLPAGTDRGDEYEVG